MSSVLTVADISSTAIRWLLTRYGLTVEWVSDDADIVGSFWGDAEAGIVQTTVYVRADTPVHSLLHEMCHIICMPADRRRSVHRDAGGDDLEESAVCYLQVLLASCLEQVGIERVMQDMDTWGYSFRLGSTQRWFEHDAADARQWLQQQGLIDESGTPTFALRQ